LLVVLRPLAKSMILNLLLENKENENKVFFSKLYIFHIIFL